MRSDTESQNLASPQQLISEYQRLWQHRGFTYPAFLRWRSVSGVARWSLVLRSQDFPPPLLASHEYDTLGIQRDPDAEMVNPEWADLWAEHFGSIYDASEWYAAGIDSPAEAMSMKRIGYRKPHRARGFHALLRDKGWLQVIQHRDDIKIPLHHNVVSIYGDEAMTAEAVTALALNPDFGFSQGQVNAIRDTIMKADFTTPKRVTENCVEIANLCDRMISLGWTIPDGDGMFTQILEVVESYTNFGHSLVHLLISQCGCNRDTFLRLMTTMMELEENEHRGFTRGRLAKVVYSLNTGVPMQWVDDDVVDEVISGAVPESGWVVESDSHKLTPRPYYREDDLSVRIDVEARRLAGIR